ncbi:hypothetical protein HELRODRAFT_186255 [Helobdella robusta]|uniref:6-phosphofructo-2-kinase domain-containing protein n=1 Tax=Helobdella robusta TaxID=6412 RepID=T1FNV6_HELRO|nr:hypothetical protein HELRODRAFT_186255 [Helobdella robusta]ESO11360.1 hypothetical protein HELRODRAFT_186255 [Helobdella robusta]
MFSNANTKNASSYSSGPQLMNMANLTIAPCAIIMVGLPARGKTYMAKKLSRYLNWIGLNTKAFSVGDYRRKASSSFNNLSDFYDPNNIEASKVREKCILDALGDLQAFLMDKGEVGVFDATNGRRDERQHIFDVLTIKCGFKTFFVESFCHGDKIVEANIRQVKINHPDYRGLTVEEAVADFKKKIKRLELEYETIDEIKDEHLSYMKIIDQGRMFLVNKVHGHVESRVVYYLMNIHVLPRTIYLTRHGESVMNLAGRIGGDGDLSENGVEFSKVLTDYVNNLNKPNLKIWTSLMKRTIQTVSGLNNQKEHWKALNEIDAGVCEGMTYQEIHEKYPEEFALRDNDKYHYRYPGGESYEDLVARLEPVIMELERQEDVLVICHQAVARCLLAYFMDKPQEELPYLKIPLHNIIKLTPVAYGCEIEFINLNVKAVDTHRPLPANLQVTRSAHDALATVPPTPTTLSI